jgi:hypothetical protein
MKNQIEIEAQNAGIQQATANAQLQAIGQRGAGVPGNAPGPTVDQGTGQANAAQNQAAAQAAPTLGQDQNAPASQAGTGPNAGQAAGAAPAASQASTLVQDGKAFNRIISKGSGG